MRSRKILLLGAILLLGVGYATVSTTLYINGDVNISVNEEDFDVRFTRSLIDSVDKSSEVISEDGKIINFTTKELQALGDKSVLDFEITNNSNLYDAEVSIECTTGERSEYYQITQEAIPTILAKTTKSGKIEVEKIKSTTEEVEEAFICMLSATASERTTKGEEGKTVLNKNIVNSDLECLKNKEAGSCAPGTEIRYMVNDTTEKTFNVLHDDGETLTLQQNENTTSTVQWYSEADNTKGPTVALTALEAATNGWTNVNIQKYAMGTTNFNGTNAYTGCLDSEGNYNCTVNTYRWESRSARARMITTQEVTAVGCTYNENSCPAWMLTGDFYWTMSSHSPTTNRAFCVGTTYGSLRNTSITDGLGARAVIEINKYI